MIYNYPYNKNYYNKYNIYQKHNYLKNNNLKECNIEKNNYEEVVSQKVNNENNLIPKEENNYKYKNEDDTIINLFGIKLCFDDLLILGLLYLLYTEDVKDISLYIVLILLLLN